MAGCAAGADEPVGELELELHVSNIGPIAAPPDASMGQAGPKVGAAIGAALPGGDLHLLSKHDTTVVVETSADGASWQPASDVVVDFGSPPLSDVALVVDNSGSEGAFLDDIASALTHFSHVVLASSHDDRLGLVRVSTAAHVVAPLTPSEDEMESAISELFIANGWTALWDGIRLGNEVLEDGVVTATASGSACYSGAYRSIVVFTDGRDNNSSDEHDTKYAGDGIATQFADLLALEAGGTTTPVHVVAVGEDVDEDALTSLAKLTGGHFTPLQNYGQLIGALHGTAAKLKALTPVCFVPAACGDTQARLRVTTKEKSKPATVEIIVDIPQLCGGVGPTE